MPQLLSTDVLIVGGGIAGLWLNARLRQAGYATVLVENACLGGGQTVKSQGIIHGGTKYALHGALTGASEAIAGMPKRWRACLAGNGELDLQGVRVLSDAHYLWSPGSLVGNLGSFFASRALRTRVEQVHGEALPAALQHPDFKGKAYRLDELVLDIPSLIARLAELSGDSLLLGQRVKALLDSNRIVGAQIDGYEIRAQRTVLSAGAGNKTLLHAFGYEQPAMQRRPLHMVMVKSPCLRPLYAHCLGAGTKPLVTVTTHPTAAGPVWYLGGDLAESAGVSRNESEQIDAARELLNRLLPWIDLQQAQWATLRVDRIEPAQNNLLRPDNAFVAEQGCLLVGWPTKLALAPDFADRVAGCLHNDGILPAAQPLPIELPRPPIAAPVWETLFP